MAHDLRHVRVPQSGGAMTACTKGFPLTKRSWPWVAHSAVAVLRALHRGKVTFLKQCESMSPWPVLTYGTQRNCQPSSQLLTARAAD